MTKWLESQIETRARYDAEMTERAYTELAFAANGSNQHSQFTVDDIENADGAVRACLKYYGAEPGKVPENIQDFEERLDWLCRPTGTMRRNVNLEKNWYKNAFGAMIGRLDTGEIVALLPKGVRGYCYIDPHTGRRVKVTAANVNRISNDAVLFYKPLPAKPLDRRDFAAFIVSVFDRTDYLLVLAASIAVVVIGLFPAWANKVAFDVVAPSGQASLILPIAALLLGVAISAALISATRNLVMQRVSTKLNVVSTAALFARVLALPSSFFKQYSSGNLAARVANISMLAQKVADAVLGTGLTTVLSLVYVIQIAVYAPSLALPALVIFLLQGALIIVGIHMTMGYERLTVEASAKHSGTVTSLLNGIQKIKLTNAEDRAFAKWAHVYSDYAQAAYKRPLIPVALPALVAFIGLLGTIVIYYFAGVSSVSMPDYMAFNVAFGQMTAAMTALTGIAPQIAQIRPTLDMVAPILEATPEVAEDKPSVETITGGVEVSGVSFRYSDETPYVLNDLSFTVKPGEYVALVGKSGCGKSTILRLLLGFEKPLRGTIFYGTHDVTKVDLRSLRRHIGVVMQDGKLFMGDILNNITISTPAATLEDAWEAAELAGIADDIRKMPMGMQTYVTEGSGGISGGQRQRLMIARAICGHRRMLMFDEATSALDNKTQRHVSDSLDTLNCTRIVVAHRLSTVRHCDRILVVDGGRIAEEGTYEELIQKNGLFAELVERQRLDKEG